MVDRYLFICAAVSVQISLNNIFSQVTVQFDETQLKFRCLTTSCKTVHEFIGGYIFLCMRGKDKNQNKNKEMFFRLTSGLNVWLMFFSCVDFFLSISSSCLYLSICKYDFLGVTILSFIMLSNCFRIDHRDRYCNDSLSVLYLCCLFTHTSISPCGSIRFLPAPLKTNQWLCFAPFRSLAPVPTYVIEFISHINDVIFILL